MNKLAKKDDRAALSVLILTLRYMEYLMKIYKKFVIEFNTKNSANPYNKAVLQYYRDRQKSRFYCVRKLFIIVNSLRLGN